MDAGLLTGTDTDGHAVFYVADGIGLGVFQGDEGDDQVALSCAGISLFFVGIFVSKSAVILASFRSCSKVTP